MIDGIGGKQRGSIVPTNIITIKGASIPKALAGFSVRFAASNDLISSEKIGLLDGCLEKFNQKVANDTFLAPIAKILKEKQVQNVLIAFSYDDNGFSMTVLGYKEGSPTFKAILILI